MEVDQELFRKLFALTETNAQQLSEIREILTGLEQKVDKLEENVNQGFEVMVQCFAALGTSAVQTAADD